MAESRNVPLAVDLDGTVIRTDMMWESLARLLRRNPFSIFQILFWWSRGRAWLKKKLVARVTIDPASLPYNETFLEWLRTEKAAGRKIVLATASDRRMAEPIAQRLGLFDEILASDGRTNLRRDAKRQALVKKFGEGGFDYAGNSKDDLLVWDCARLAIVVNASPAVLEEAGKMAGLGPIFCKDYSAHETGRRFAVELFWRSGYLTAAFAGLLLALAFPSFSIAGFAWIAPALLLAASHGKTGGDAFRAGYAGGLVFWLSSLYWLLLMPAPVYSVVLAWVALAAFVALYFGVWTWLMSRFPFPMGSWSARMGWALAGAAAWVALEMVRARLLGGFPWSFLGVSQYQLAPLLQVAAFTGVYGVSFLVAWFSLALYSASRMILHQPANRHAWQAEIFVPMIAVIGCYTAGYFAMNGGVTPKNFLRVTAVQPSVPQTLIWDPSEDARRFAQLLELSQHALTNGPDASDLLVWPESAVPEIDEATYQAINHFALSNHVWLILNAEDADIQPGATNFYNAAFLVGPDGEWRRPFYHKRDLVVFGEYVPLVKWLPFLAWLTPITGGWTPGEKPVTFELQPHGEIEIARPGAPESSGETGATVTVKCAPLICFEDTFPGAARDSAQDDVDFLVNLTNDGWFRQSAEQRQHMANAIFRAVENGIPLLRCANNGVTCLIDGRGRLVKVFRDAQNGEYGPGALTVEIPLLSPAEKSAPTFYNRHGDWFGWGCVGITTLLFARSFIKRRQALPWSRT